ncbi:MAG: Major facilitator superfamily [candidate division CPR1 bacterium GW2011_GWA2_42_17]|uniref:Major facilitator superfamily n=1 Tax=candidate division CPR1 bacterium GW2011_GWA2_42_17 TaxID=1618341 RepID=A0A0G1BD51_9BACT|nr:MAG: Major facilitator superfamily [candidate division CPR1 bacterium GW2011_GWA2_42_17]
MISDSEKGRQSSVFVIYLLGFLFTLHGALPAYINSTFLSHFTTERFVGIIYTVSAILSVGAFVLIPKLLRKFGNYRTMFGLLIIDFISLLNLIWIQNVFIVSVSFIASFVAIAIIGFNLDVFLESFSKDAVTGKIRGTLLSTSNIAWIIAPLIGSFILTNSDYWKIFLAAVLILLPVFFLLGNNLKNFKDPEYKHIPIRNATREIIKDKNIRGVFIVSFLLQFFYSWMVIYTPIYLYTYLGFSWQEIGVMFSIMLLPFVLTEAPLGKLADTRWGEKEVMSVGFIIMALATGMIAFIETKSFILWTALLFMSRVGASMVEVMSETYFFKRVDSKKANIIGIFRTMRPWAYVISPILATFLFAFSLPVKYIFFVLALIMFLGLHWSLELKDTR